MAKYLSKYPQYTLTARGEVVQFHMGTNGIMERHESKPAFQIIFRPIATGAADGPAVENPIERLNPRGDAMPLPDEGFHLGQEYIRQGIEFWTKHRRGDDSPGALGAIPQTTPGGMGGRSTIAFRPESRWGYYDTDWVKDDQDRAIAEAKLEDRDLGFGIDWIRLVEPRKDAPWPSYDLLRPKSGRSGSIADQVKRAIVDFGIDPRIVRAYEMENENRVEVLDAIAEAERGDVEPETVEVNDDSLTTQVP